MLISCVVDRYSMTHSLIIYDYAACLVVGSASALVFFVRVKFPL